MPVNIQNYLALEPIVEHSTPDMTIVEVLAPNECLPCAITRNQQQAELMGNGFISINNEHSPRFLPTLVAPEIENTPLNIQAYLDIPTILKHCVSNVRVVEYTAPIDCHGCAVETNGIQQMPSLGNGIFSNNVFTFQMQSISIQIEPGNKRLLINLLIFVLFLVFIAFACSYY